MYGDDLVFMNGRDNTRQTMRWQISARQPLTFDFIVAKSSQLRLDKLDFMNNQPLRPLTFHSGQEFLNLGDAARVNAVLSGLPVNSLNSFPLSNGPSAGYAEHTLFGQGNQMFPHQMGNESAGPEDSLLSEERLQGLRGKGPSRSQDSRGSGAYASRHQAAEQRRRTRINERLDLLRKIVPHAERANTACFLEEVIKHIDSLKRRVSDLETQLRSKPGMGSMGMPTNNSRGPTPTDNVELGGAWGNSQQQALQQLQQQHMLGNPRLEQPQAMSQQQMQLSQGQQLLTVSNLESNPNLLKQYQGLLKAENNGQLLLSGLGNPQQIPGLNHGLALQQLQAHAQGQLVSTSKPQAQLSNQMDLANQLGLSSFNLFQIPNNGLGDKSSKAQVQPVNPMPAMHSNALLRLAAQHASSGVNGEQWGVSSQVGNLQASGSGVNIDGPDRSKTKQPSPASSDGSDVPSKKRKGLVL
eukprot:gene16186-22347_t